MVRLLDLPDRLAHVAAVVRRGDRPRACRRPARDRRLGRRGRRTAAPRPSRGGARHRRLRGASRTSVRHLANRCSRRQGSASVLAVFFAVAFVRRLLGFCFRLGLRLDWRRLGAQRWPYAAGASSGVAFAWQRPCGSRDPVAHDLARSASASCRRSTGRSASRRGSPRRSGGRCSRCRRSGRRRPSQHLAGTRSPGIPRSRTRRGPRRPRSR